MYRRRVFLLGATGYTGHLLARELALAGERPILVGRNRVKLEALRNGLGVELEIRQADAADPQSIAEAIEPESVLVTTAGPFASTGFAAAQAALRTRSHYLDSAGEPGFHARMLELHHHSASSAGVALLTGFGTEWVLGNLAGALALEAAPGARRLEVGYFLRFNGRPLGPVTLARSFAAASLQSGISLLAEPGFRWSDSRLSLERFARRQARFSESRVLLGVSVGGTEHLSLPRLYPSLREVGVYLGWFGRFSPLVRLAAGPASAILSRRAFADAAGRLIERVGGREPGAGLGASGSTSSLTIARAVQADDSGVEVRVREGDLYSLTAKFLACGAMHAASGKLHAAGVVGPVEALGLASLRDAARDAGLVEELSQVLEPAQ